MSSRAEAIEALIAAGRGYGSEVSKADAERALDALLSPSTTMCETCGGTGFTVASLCREVAERARPDPNFTGAEPCPAGCDHGQKVGPPHAVLYEDLEQVEGAIRVSLGATSANAWATPIEPVFRLRTAPGEREEDS